MIISKYNDLNRKMLLYKTYFDNMFKNIDSSINLDDQQRKAILLDTDNLLVVAGAGSGKTITMVAKVKYLIDKCGYKQNEIAVLSFTSKVKEEMEKMIHNNFELKDVNIFTFHGLGLKIIQASGENVNGIADERIQYRIFSDYIKEELFPNKEKFEKLINAFSKLLYFGDDWKKFKNFKEYHDYVYGYKMKKAGLDIDKYNDEQIKRRREYKKTIRGEYVASKEEVDIANFLYKNGIEYVYEKKFEYSKPLYRPDFYIYQLEKENYIEHFGIDQNGYNGMFTADELNNYLKRLKIKLSYHNEEFNKGLFIVTFSKEREGTYLTSLKKQLKNKGYQPMIRSEEEIYTSLKETSQDTYITNFIDKMLIPFVSIFKQNRFVYSDFDELILKNSGILKEQLLVMKDFFKYYETSLKEKHLIDFEDMINKAYSVMPMIKEKNLGVDFKYLIIDEYQDISNQRLDLVKRMEDLFDCKVMAVGDDWQSIFGYSGSRIELFKNFSKYLKNSKSIPIENTYRNSQELIDIAGNFILKNSHQIKKRLKSKKHLNNPVEIFVYNDSDIAIADINRSKLIDKIVEHVYKNNPKDKILLLGRYNKDIYSIKNDYLFNLQGNKVKSKKYPKAKLDFLTIHKAKGLGYDQCILLNLTDGKYGFPSKIEDEPIIKLIRPKYNEDIDYPEERRLFYVALTRTKNKIYLLVPKSRASSFSKELKNYSNIVIHNVV